MRAIFLLLLLPSFAGAKFALGESVPLDRLIANVKAHFAGYQNQAEAHYLLGRLQSLAFSGNAKTVEVIRQGEQELPRLLSRSPVQEDIDPPPFSTRLTPETRELFFSVFMQYRQAIALDPGNALYHFSLGWMAEQGQRFAGQIGLPPADLTSGGGAATWRLLAIREYRVADRLADMPLNYVGTGPLLAQQSRQALVNSLHSEIQERSARTLSDSDKRFIVEAKREIASAQADLDRLKRLPRAITPLIFSLHPHVRLGDLLSAATVTFDLDGFTEGRRWPWVRHDTAMLVWDPAREGRIDSGRQLFGSVTWWMFWKNGFEPLAALDNNGDGWLTGDELDGISVWQDRNGDGVPDSGEVIPVQEFGIAAIAVRPRGEVDGAVANRDGVILRDGRALTLFDWVPRANPASAEKSGSHTVRREVD